MTWRYLAQRLPGQEIIHPDLPLTGVSITQTLSGPGGLSATVPADLPGLMAPDGQPLLTEWGTAIWAEADGQIRGGGIVDRAPSTGNSLSVECVGFSGYPKDMPYVGNGRHWTREDPLVILRFVWDHLQSFPGGDLGVVVDPLTTPVRVGEEQYVPIDESLEDFDTTFDDGPIRLNWWDVHDLGDFIDDLAERTPFDYLEQSDWGPDGKIVHRLRLGYPRIGRRLTDLRFVIGENVTTIPEVSTVEEGYASEVLVLGAGEGREKLVSPTIGTTTGRLRRVATVVDDTLKRQGDVNARARKERDRRAGLREVTSITVLDHPNAPLGSWRVGDSIRLQGEYGWEDIDMWLRITEATITPADAEVASLTLARLP